MLLPRFFTAGLLSLAFVCPALAEVPAGQDKQPAPSEAEAAKPASRVIILAPQEAPVRKVEVVFVLDTTGSMADLIDGAKKKIWSIANAIVNQYPNSEIKFGLVGYRDRGDEYVTKTYPLTTDMQSMYAKLLAFKADGGGDTPESVNEALDVGVTKMGWSDKGQVKADRILFLVGDAPPHMDYKQDRKYKTVIAEAVQKGIIVNAVQAGDDYSTRQVWQEMARLGKGDYLAIPQSGGRVVIIETPYDEEILILQRRINTTIIPYGSGVMQEEVKSKAKMYDAEPAASAAEMSSYVNKSGKGKSAVTGGGDLVNAVEEKVVNIADVKETELPPEMKKMSVDERAAYVKAKITERGNLSRELAGKVSERDKYIADQAAKAPAPKADDSFDAGVKDALQKQMK